MVKLVISDNEGTTTVVPLVRDEVSIGREEGNTIRLTERNISRRHAVLTKVNGHYEIADLKSYNGLTLNGEAIAAQSELSPGDQVQIGDYSITVQAEAVAVAGEDEATRVAAMPQPELPARVVMLAEPTPGAEFSLPVAGVAKLGRSEELAIPINHRSVSREHAEISREGDGYVLMDLASANGLSVNGKKVTEHMLTSGDVIELGQVMFRYVEPGEIYAFDPQEASHYARAMGARSTANARIAMGMVAIAVAVAIGLMSGDDAEPAAATTVTDPADSPAAAGAPEPTVDDGAYDAALSACREALAGRRYAEAMAHSGLALKARPGDSAAVECQQQGQQRHEDEQTFVRGEAALGAGDPEAAHKEFQRLAPESEFRSRPAVAEALAQIATTRVANARSLLPSNTVEASRLARGVLALPGVPHAQEQAARSVIGDARRAEEAIVAAAAEQPEAAPVRERPSRSSRRAASPKKPRAPRGESGMKAASACLAKGDNQCVIKALAGKARTAQEMGLLIETYRAMGNAQAARKYMTLYVKRFPTARRANSYQRMLGQ